MQKTGDKSPAYHLVTLFLIMLVFMMWHYLSYLIRLLLGYDFILDHLIPYIYLIFSVVFDKFFSLFFIHVFHLFEYLLFLFSVSFQVVSYSFSIFSFYDTFFD